MIYCHFWCLPSQASTAHVLSIFFYSRWFEQFFFSSKVNQRLMGHNKFGIALRKQENVDFIMH